VLLLTKVSTFFMNRSGY